MTDYGADIDTEHRRSPVPHGIDGAPRVTNGLARSPDTSDDFYVDDIAGVGSAADNGGGIERGYTEAPAHGVTLHCGFEVRR